MVLQIDESYEPPAVEQRTVYGIQLQVSKWALSIRFQHRDVATRIVTQLSRSHSHSELSLQSKCEGLKNLTWIILKQHRNDVKLNQESFSAVITPKGSTPLSEAGTFLE